LLRLRPARFSRFVPRRSGRVSRPKRRPVEKPVFSQKTGFCVGLPQGAGRFCIRLGDTTRAAARVGSGLSPREPRLPSVDGQHFWLSLRHLLGECSTPPPPATRGCCCRCRGCCRCERAHRRLNDPSLQHGLTRANPNCQKFLAGGQTTPPRPPRKQKSENQNSEINCGGKSSTPPPPATRGCCCR